MSQGAQWEEFATVAARRRKHQVRTILHTKDRGDQDAANAMPLHGVVASLWQLESNASMLGGLQPVSQFRLWGPTTGESCGGAQPKLVKP